MVFPGLVFFFPFFIFPAWRAEEEFVLALHPSCGHAARHWLSGCLWQLLLKGDVPPTMPDHRQVCSAGLFLKVLKSNAPKQVTRGSWRFPLHSWGQVQLVEKEPSI